MQDSKYFFLFCTILLLGMATPFVDGYYFKQTYLQHIAALNHNYQTNANIKVLEYHLGWLSSDIKLSLEIPNVVQSSESANAAPMMPSGVTITQHITHGPIVRNSLKDRWAVAKAIVQSSVLLPEPFNTKLLGSDADLGVLRIYSIAMFGGEYYSQISAPAINISGVSGTQFTWQGLKGENYIQTYNNEIYRTKATYDIGQLTAQDHYGTLATQPISLIYDAVRDQVGLWDGTYQIAIPGIAFNGAPPIKVKDLNITDKFGVDKNNYFNNQLQITLNNLTLSDITINASSIKLSVNNLNAQTLVDYRNSMQLDSPVTSDQRRALAIHLITPSTLISENADIETSYGHLTSDGEVSWPSSVKTPEDINNGNYKINLRVDSRLVNKMIELIYPAATAAIAPPDEPVSPEQALLNQIDAWTNQNLISASTNVELKDLLNTHLSSQDFSDNLDGFVLRKDLTADLANQLKAQYAQMLADKQNVPSKPKIVHPVVTQQSPADEKKQQIQAWIKQGYIIEDKSDYVTSIVKENGVTKINGIVKQ